MATYLPGITDYIPQVNFHPDLNFYNYALQTKEAQYKQGYQKISGVYGALLNSPMLRDSDVKRRDDFFKKAQDTIEKMSSLDLSRSDNIQSAYGVFQPLIDDQNITSDMAYTKQYMSEMSRADALRNCMDPKKCPGYWEEGQRALQYWAQDYSKTDDNQALSFERPRYVPYVDVGDKFMSHMKGMGFKVTRTGVSRDGNFIVTTTNGNQVVPSLFQYARGIIGSDPRVRDMYKVKAYNQRHEWIAENTPKYGDPSIAEEAYNSQMMSDVQVSQQHLMSALGMKSSEVENKIKLAQKKLKESGGRKADDPDVLSLTDLLGQKDAIDKAKGVTQETLDNVDPKNIFSADNIAKRSRIDRAVGESILNGDLIGLSSAYANMTSEEKMVANPFAVAYRNHVYRMEEGQEKFKQNLELTKLKASLKNGAPQVPGQPYMPLDNARFDKGSSTGELDVWGQQKSLQDSFTGKLTGAQHDVVSQFYKTLANYAVNFMDSDPDKAKVALHHLQNVFGENLPKGPDGTIATANMDDPKYYDKVVALSKTNDFMSNFSDVVGKITPSTLEAQKENLAIESDAATIKSNINNLFKYLPAQGVKDTDVTFMKSIFGSGMPISKDEFYDQWAPHFNGLSRKHSDDLYDEYSDMFKKHYSSGYKVGEPGKEMPIIKPLTFVPGLNNTGGTGSRAIGQYTNPVNPGAADMDALAIHRNMIASGDYTILPGTSPTSQDSSTGVGPEGPDPRGMRTVLQAYLNDVDKETRLEGAKKPKFTAEGIIVPHTTILNSADKVGYTIEIPEAWWNHYVKSHPQSKSQFKYDDIKDQTIIWNKDKAPAGLFDKFNPKPIRQKLLTGGSVNIDVPSGGKITMTMNSSGGVDLSGKIRYVDEKGQWRDVEASNINHDFTTDPDEIFDYLAKELPRQASQNQKVWNSPNNPYRKGNITDISQINLTGSDEEDVADETDTQDESD